MRVIGCVLVTKRSIHQNVEITIEHVRHRWLKPDLWSMMDGCKCAESSYDGCPCHVLDDMDLLVASITLYASQTGGPSGPSIRQHLRNTFFLLIITLIIDGGVDWVEPRLYVRLWQAGRMENRWKSVLKLKDEFVAGKGRHINTVYELVQETLREAGEDDAQRKQAQNVPWFSLMVVPVNAVMNAWTLHRVMLNCRVNIIGPPCVAALLEAFFLHEDGLSPFQRVDCVRVIGCVVAAKRCIHPNVEIIIEHLRHQWLQKDLWPVADDCTCRDPAFDESCPHHVLDDVDLLIGSLCLYASQAQGPSAHEIRQHLQNMYFLLIVSLVIDGSVGWVERRLYNRLCHAGRMQNAWKGVLRLKKDFVAGKGIHVTAVYALVQEISDEAAEGDQQELQRVSWRESLQYMADRAAKSLVW